MNEHIHVDLAPATSNGRLYPFIDPETRFLMLGTISRRDRGDRSVPEWTEAYRRDWARTYVIDDLVVLEASEKGLIRHAYVIWSAERWRTASDFRGWRTLLGDVRSTQERADVYISHPDRGYQWFNSVTVRMLANEEREWVTVVWEPATTGSLRCVELSPDCIALVENDVLVGFEAHVPPFVLG